VRETMDTQSEFEPIEIATGDFLDDIAAGYGVTRLVAEPDVSLRERTRDAMGIRRASDRAERGESLLPPDLGMFEVRGDLSAEIALRAENERLRLALAEAREETARLRAVLIDLRAGADRGDFGYVGAVLESTRP